MRQILDVNHWVLALSPLSAPIGEADVRFEYQPTCVFQDT